MRAKSKQKMLKLQDRQKSSGLIRNDIIWKPPVYIPHLFLMEKPANIWGANAIFLLEMKLKWSEMYIKDFFS